MNNDNRNGKEVHKGQIPGNIQKEGRPKPANRMRKKNNPVAKDVIPPEPKKIQININKNTGNPQKRSQKGQVIKLEDKDSRIHPVETPLRENTRPNTRPQPSSNHKKSFTIPSPEFPITTEKTQSARSKEDFQLFKDASAWLLIVAAILFVTWAVMFFYYKIGGNSHMILALAVICAIVSVVGRKKK